LDSRFPTKHTNFLKRAALTCSDKPHSTDLNDKTL
jgi:hypothetical protein